MSIDEPRPGTTAAIDRRVEHLAEKVDGLELRMAAVEQNQNHARELQALQFAAIQSNSSAVLAKLEGIEASLRARDALIAAKDVEAARYMSDPMATPAGQSLMGLVNSITPRVAAVEKKLYMAGGAIALITFLSPIVAPLIRAALHLP